MSRKGSFTGRAENTLDRTRMALKQNPAVLPTAALLAAMDEAGPSLARGVLTALDVNIDETLADARLIASERGAELQFRWLPSRPASLPMIVRRAVEEADMLGYRKVGTEHLLLATLSAHEDPTTSALRVAGVTQDTVRGTLRRMLPAWTDDGSPRPRAIVA
jgi:ATP-dependent Clp protease ATP-binding subunit ClpA